jgi:hypothetical protein
VQGLDLNFHCMFSCSWPCPLGDKLGMDVLISFCVCADHWPWTEGEDARGCIENAIRKGSCAGDVAFKNGGCYKRS